MFYLGNANYKFDKIFAMKGFISFNIDEKNYVNTGDGCGGNSYVCKTSLCSHKKFTRAAIAASLFLSKTRVDCRVIL